MTTDHANDTPILDNADRTSELYARMMAEQQKAMIQIAEHTSN